MADQKKGISRIKRKTLRAGEKGMSWDYFNQKGQLISDEAIIQRCNKLVLPPAWEDVWISSDPESNLQATGKDAKGRLQYRYHENWTKARAEKKFDGLTGFAHHLPIIRKHVEADIQLSGMPRKKVVALVVKLMDIYHIRVGNDEYARKNQSYGLTTLKEGHMTIDRSKTAEGELDAIFEFKGKSGKDWSIRIWEDDLALLIEESGKVGGLDTSQDLFRYEDENGRDFDIKSNHINEYLDAITPKNHKVTAKDFRTWAATWKMASRLSKQLDPEKATARKKLATQIIKTVSSDLGNTPTVCRSSYIHPAILNDWQEGTFRSKWNKHLDERKLKGLSKEETITLRYLERK
jgi:DNA topoisomerase-1